MDSLYDRLDEAPYFIVVQIKEKFALLRIYVSDTRKESYGDLPEEDKEYSELLDFISELEHMSGTICEECGLIGKRRPGGWVKTLCDKCYEEQEK